MENTVPYELLFSYKKHNHKLVQVIYDRGNWYGHVHRILLWSSYHLGQSCSQTHIERLCVFRALIASKVTLRVSYCFKGDIRRIHPLLPNRMQICRRHRPSRFFIRAHKLCFFLSHLAWATSKLEYLARAADCLELFENCRKEKTKKLWILIASVSVQTTA